MSCFGIPQVRGHGVFPMINAQILTPDGVEHRGDVHICVGVHTAGDGMCLYADIHDYETLLDR